MANDFTSEFRRWRINRARTRRRAEVAFFVVLGFWNQFVRRSSETKNKELRIEFPLRTSAPSAVKMALLAATFAPAAIRSARPSPPTRASRPRSMPGGFISGLLKKCATAAVDRVRANRSSAAVFDQQRSWRGKDASAGSASTASRHARQERPRCVERQCHDPDERVAAPVVTNMCARNLSEELLRRFSDDKTYLAWITAKKLRWNRERHNSSDCGIRI